MIEAVVQFGILIGCFFGLYVLIALGRIWFYAKRQTQLLEQFRSILSGKAQS